jgi:hypothetical protein
MADRALPLIMPRGHIGGMAARAILVAAGMFEGVYLPGGGGMAVRALPAVMPAGCLHVVTALAIRVTGVVEACQAPAAGGMAVRARAGIVPGRGAMAFCTIAHLYMHKPAIGPRAGAVTALAILCIMIYRWAVADIAAVIQIVHKADLFPIL